MNLLRKPSLITIGAAAATTTLGIAVTVFAARPDLVTLYLHWGFPIFSLLAGLTLWYAWGLLRQIKPWARPEPLAILVGIGAATLVFLVCHPRLKVFSDETNLIGLGWGMASSQRLQVPNQGLFIDGIYRSWGYTVPDRPLLYPWILSVIDLVTGFRIANSFVINFLMFSTFLGLAFGLARKRFGVAAGISLMLLALAQPSLIHVATSGSYEPLSFLLICATLLLLWRFLEDGAPATLALLVVVCGALTNVRQESGVFFVAMLIALMLQWRITWSVVKPHLAFYLLAPLFGMMEVWYLMLYGDQNGAAHQIGRTGIPDFSLNHLTEHSRALANALWQGNAFYPYCWPSIALGLTAWPVLVVMLIKRRSRTIQQKELRFWAVASFMFVAHFLICAFYWGGIPLAPISARYYTPEGLFLAAVLWRTVMFLPTRFARPLALGIAVVCLGFTFPRAVTNEFPLTEVSTRQLDFVTEETAKFGTDGLLIVARIPGRYTVQGYGAVSCEYFEANLPDMEARLRRGEIRQLFFVEERRPERPTPNPSCLPPGDLKAVVVAEKQTGADVVTRLARYTPN